MKKVEIFQRELSLIHSDVVRNITMAAIERISDSFFKEAASASGKYHPQYGLGEAGLLRHTKAVTSFANMFNQYSAMTQYQKDIIIASCILHDSCKRGVNFESDNMEHEHPMLVWKLLNADSMDPQTRRIWVDVNNMIATHMGQWVTSSHSSYTLPKITKRTQLIVHWADYLGSRKYINIKGYGNNLNYPFDQWTGSNIEIFDKELKLIKDTVLRNMVKTALSDERYRELNKMSSAKSGVANYNKPGGMITRIKASLLIAQSLLELEKTFIEEHDADIIYASIFFNNIGYMFNVNTLNGEQMIYWSEILCNKKAFQCQTAVTWEQMVYLVCEKVATIPSLEINVIPEKEKAYKPATEKQINRIKALIEEFSSKPDYDGRYNNIQLERLSLGQAGKYISEMKAMQNA